MRKCDYRFYFAKIQKFIKLRQIYEPMGIHPSTFSRFMKGEAYDYVISIDKLEMIYDGVQKTLLNLMK